MRAFVALDLPGDTRDALAALQAELRTGRKVPPENLHLTLAFLDDQPEPALRALHQRLSGIDLPAFGLRLAGLDLLGGKRPKLLFIRARGGAPLSALRHAVRRAAQQAGIELPRERFRPHVTLARFRRDMDGRALSRLGRFLSARADAALPEVTATHFGLYRSVLHPDGAEHDLLSDYALAAPDPQA